MEEGLGKYIPRMKETKTVASSNISTTKQYFPAIILHVQPFYFNGKSVAIYSFIYKFICDWNKLDP